MNRNDIIRMAREAGARLDKHNGGFIDQSVLLRFAVLVAAAEREACIDIVAMHGGSVEIEAAIRARGQA